MLSVAGLHVPHAPDVSLPRASQVTFTGTLPPMSHHIEITWPRGAGALSLRQTGVSDPWQGFLLGGETSEWIAISGSARLGAWVAFIDFIPVGFDHILPNGLEHILFVLALFFLSTSWQALLWQVSALTLAHTLKLALATLGAISIPPYLVEPLIALSITFVIAENLVTQKLHTWRPVIVFAFGQLHGLGFASVLQDFGLPDGQFVPALIGFNLGVELGQLAVIAIAFCTVGQWFRNKLWYRTRIAMPASGVIALIGLYWFIDQMGGI